MNKTNYDSKNKNINLGDDVPVAGPQTLLQLLKLLLKGMIVGLRKNILIMICLSLLTWLVHTYLLVVKNEGFILSNSQFTSMLALKGAVFSGTLFWTLLGMIFMNIFYKVIQGKLKHSIKKMRSSPKWVRQSIGQAGSFAFPIILGASALALYSGVKLNNPFVNLLLAFLLVGSIIAQQESLLALTLHLSWSDAHHLLKKPVKKFKISWAVMAITGGAIGFTLAIFLVDSTFFVYLFVLVMVGTMIALIFIKKDKTGGRAVPVLLILIYICMMAMIPAFAHDGGWQESGGTFDKWIVSEGALIAISLGLPPALGMGLGVLIGSTIAQGIVTTGGQSIAVGGITEGTKDASEDVEEQDLKEGIEEEKVEEEKVEEERVEEEKVEEEKVEEEKVEEEKVEEEKVEEEKVEEEEIKEEEVEEEIFVEPDQYDADGFDKDGYDKDRYNKDGYNKKGYNCDGYNKSGFDPWGFNKQGVNWEGQTRGEVMQNLLERQKRREKISSGWGGWLGDFLTEFGRGAGRDISSLPGYAIDKGGDLVKGTQNVVEAIYNETTDRKNWEALSEAKSQTINDLLKKPGESLSKIGRFYGDIAEYGENIVKGIYNDPVTFIKTSLGVDNWEKVVDGTIPFGERVARALYGAVDSTLTLAGGGAKIAQLADKVSDAAKAVKGLDVAGDLAKGAKAVDSAADLSKGAKALDTAGDMGKGVKTVGKGANVGKKATRAHGYAFEKAKQKMLQRALSDPKIPSHIRGHIKSELNRLKRIAKARARGMRPPGGSARRIRMPGGKGNRAARRMGKAPGKVYKSTYDAGHRVPGLDTPENLRFELPRDNRRRPHLAKKLGISDKFR